MSDVHLALLKAELEDLTELIGYAEYLQDEAVKLSITATALERLATIMPGPIADILTQAAADVRASSESASASAQTCANAVQEAINRLADNQTLTEAEKSVILESLTAAKTAADAAKASSDAGAAAANTVDPNVADGGVVVDPENPGEVIPAPPQT